MKKFLAIFLCVCISGLTSCSGDISAESKLTENVTATESVATEPVSEMQAQPVYAEDLNDGTYAIEVKSSSSMFKIIDCELTVENGKMSAVMTLSGTGYEKLFMGKGEQAEQSAEENYIFFKENADGKYTYTVPVEALDKEIECSAFSIRKEKWYDRTLVFQSDKLDNTAYKKEI